MSQTFWSCREGVPHGTPALFLDRDGVVVEEVNYLHHLEDVRILEGAHELIAEARRRGYAVGLVTNQAGVGRGYYDWAAFEAVQAEIARQLGLGPEPFDFIAACGAHAEASVEALRIADHPWRKPAPGMLLEAAARFSLDLPASIMIGDQVSDLHAGSVAGVGRLVHVRTGHGVRAREAAAAFAEGRSDVLLVEDLAEAIDRLAWKAPQAT
jgi:D-glycero-D-manno-heptose 1,7-bisphosphate phosphatase